MQTAMPMTLTDDPSLQTAAAGLAAAQQRLEAALILHEALPPLAKGTADITLDRLEDTRRLTQAREAVAQCARVHDVALGMAVTRFVNARQPGRLARLRTLLTATEATLAAVRDLQTYDVDTARTLGVAPGEVPMALLLGLDLPLGRLRGEIDPPPARPRPVPPGKRRVRVLQSFFDRERIRHDATYAGQACGPIELDEQDAADAIKLGVAEAVEA